MGVTLFLPIPRLTNVQNDSRANAWFALRG